MKPQNVSACATPGTDHFSSPGTCSRAYSIRSGAGWPLNASRFSHHSRRPAMANAATVSTRPMTILAIIYCPPIVERRPP